MSQHERPPAPRTASVDAEAVASEADLFALLSHERRLWAIHYLADALDERPWVYDDDLATARQRVEAERQADCPKPKSVRRRYREHHLPPLEDKGVIEYDRHHNKIREGEHLASAKIVAEGLAGYIEHCGWSR